MASRAAANARREQRSFLPYADRGGSKIRPGHETCCDNIALRSLPVGRFAPRKRIRPALLVHREPNNRSRDAAALSIAQPPRLHTIWRGRSSRRTHKLGYRRRNVQNKNSGSGRDWQLADLPAADNE